MDIFFIFLASIAVAAAVVAFGFMFLLLTGQPNDENKDPDDFHEAMTRWRTMRRNVEND